MNIFTVSFFGHRNLNNLFAVEDKLEPIIKNLICTKEYVEFLVGRNSDFDQAAASTIRRVKKNLDYENSYLILVLPYPTSEYINNEKELLEYYDDVEICHEAAKSHYKAAISVRNKKMVDRSDLVICYVDHEYGGAYQAVDYAEKCGKTILNISK